MLKITRTPGEDIQIGAHITLHVMGVDGSRVSIGIEAPKDVVIDRAEVALRKNRHGVERGSVHALQPEEPQPGRREDPSTRIARARRALQKT